jgi:predicted metal-dependent hydrolase
VQFDLPFEDGRPAPDSVSLPAAPPEPVPDRSVAPAPLGTLYFVRNRRARRYILRVDLDGRVRVTIPRGGSKRDGSAFAAAQRHWILRQQSRLGTRSVASADAVEARARAAHELPPRLRQLATQHGLTVTRVSIRDQRTRWGSCGPDGHISLNWRLVLMPDWVRDYVLIHELMHLRRLDHSPTYWRLVAAACPDYRLARGWLRLHGNGLR